jgi:uncharacterized membrane protein YcjF (UPF0283 family)
VKFRQRRIGNLATTGLTRVAQRVEEDKADHGCAARSARRGVGAVDGDVVRNCHRGGVGVVLAQHGNMGVL